MLDFSALDVWNIVLGGMPAFAFGALVGYWMEHASRPGRRRAPAPQIIATQAPRRANVPSLVGEFMHALAAPLRAAPHVQRNEPERPRTEEGERYFMMAPGLNEYGEVVDQRALQGDRHGNP